MRKLLLTAAVIVMAASLGASTWAQTNSTDTAIGDERVQSPPTLPPDSGTITQVRIMNEQTPVAIVDDTVPLDKSVVVFRVHIAFAHCPGVEPSEFTEFAEHWTQGYSDYHKIYHHVFLGDDIMDAQYGKMEPNGEHELYMLYDVTPSLDGETFSGSGIIYQSHEEHRNHVCDTGFGTNGTSHEASDFVIRLTGKCDGSMFAMNTTDGTGYNVTSTDYHALCIP